MAHKTSKKSSKGVFSNAATDPHVRPRGNGNHDPYNEGGGSNVQKRVTRRGDTSVEVQSGDRIGYNIKDPAVRSARQTRINDARWDKVSNYMDDHGPKRSPSKPTKTYEKGGRPKSSMDPETSLSRTRAEQMNRSRYPSRVGDVDYPRGKGPGSGLKYGAGEIAAGALVAGFLNSKVADHADKYKAKNVVARAKQEKRTKAVQEKRHNAQVARKRARDGR